MAKPFSLPIRVPRFDFDGHNFPRFLKCVPCSTFSHHSKKDNQQSPILSENEKKVRSRNECQIIESIMDPIMVYGFVLGVRWTHCKECGTKFIIMVIIFQTRHKVEEASPITCHHYRSHGTFYKKSRVILAQIQLLLSDDLYFLCSMPGRHYGFFLFETLSLL